MSRRLLQRFEQGIERPGGQHVYLVDDVHAVFSHRGGEADLFPQFPDAVYPVVGGSVDLHHIGNRSVVDPPAYITLIAWITVHGRLTVDSFGQDLGAGGLTRPPGTGEQVGVSQAAGAQLILQGSGDMRLAVYVGKRLGTPFAIQHLIHNPSAPFVCKRRTPSGIRTDR